MRTNPFQKFLSSEDVEHIKVVNFFKEKLPDVIVFHVPNESKKSAFERYKHSIMGALKGIPDFVILHPKFEIKNKKRNLIYHGLLIEIKAPEHNYIVKKGKDAGKIKKTKGVLSEEQEKVIEKLNKNNYKACAVWGADEAIKIIKEYLEI